MKKTSEKKLTNFQTYSAGFGLSVILTLLAFWVVSAKLYTPAFTVGIIVTLAIIQLFVQLLFFLHLGDETKPRWRLTTLGFGLLVVVIVVFGSLWIMEHLNYNMMQDHGTEEYMERQSGF
jgi:cytochrome o ubiquinol oxidase operon protein cyoD